MCDPHMIVTDTLYRDLKMEQIEQKKSFLHIECNRSQKSLFVRAASARKMKLADWVLEQLEKAAKNEIGDF